VSDRIVARARELLEKPAHKGWQDKGRLRQIINGKHKSIDVDWWRKENGVTERQLTAKTEESFAKRLAALKAMTDPARNPNRHERLAAEAAFAKLKAAGPPTAQMRSAPGLEEYDRETARARAAHKAHLDAAFKFAKARWDAEKAASVNTAAKPKPDTTDKPKPDANTTKPRPTAKPAKKPRTADRHLEPNRDRHRPGYMREYMARRRAEQKD
jgi:hypothetical protein